MEEGAVGLDRLRTGGAEGLDAGGAEVGGGAHAGEQHLDVLLVGLMDLTALADPPVSLEAVAAAILTIGLSLFCTFRALGVKAAPVPRNP